MRNVTNFFCIFILYGFIFLLTVLTMLSSVLSAILYDINEWIMNEWMNEWILCTLYRCKTCLYWRNQTRSGRCSLQCLSWRSRANCLTSCISLSTLSPSTRSSLTGNRRVIVLRDCRGSKARFPLPELTARVNGPSSRVTTARQLR